MKLRRNQACPIPRSLSCCGRESVQRGTGARRRGLPRVEDTHHPRGYRELRSKAEMRKPLDRKIVEQNRQCAICQVAFTNHSDVVPDHIDPRGMEGVKAMEANMTSFDRLGVTLRLQRSEGMEGVRINFPREVATPIEARMVLAEMLRQARQ